MGMQTFISSEKTTVVGTGRYRDLFRSQSITVGVEAIKCVAGPHEGLMFPLKKEVISVGRALWCDIPLPKDPKVSRHHCELLLSEGGMQIRDLGSHNGTFLSDTQIYDAPLVQGFRVGDSVFTLIPEKTPKQLAVKCYDGSGNLVGQSTSMRKIFSMLPRLALSDASVLLRGETGVGKTSVALALHEQSERAAQPFVTVNCGALSPGLIESALFGHEKGAFTGANSQHIGFFEQANGGTLFLDEIGELPVALQPKLLDVIERKKLYRLGGKRELEVDIRLISATHLKLEEAIAQKTFREDLYYRLAVAELAIPPLRERLDDIPLLVEYMLFQLCPNEPPVVAASALSRLRRESWPGNIRELRNLLERTLIFLEGDTIEKDDLSFAESKGMVETPQRQHIPEGSLKEMMAAEERRLLLLVLEAFDWNVPLVIERLGISRAGLYNRMQKLGIKRP